MKLTTNTPIRLAGVSLAVLLAFSMPAFTAGGASSAPAEGAETEAKAEAPPAAPKSKPVAAPAPLAETGSEIERFCGNIADAAKDRRYALQAKELQALQTEIDDRMKALDAKRAEYETWMKKREAFLAQAQDGVVNIYKGMRPDAAAERLAELKPDLAAGILMKIDPKKAGLILNEMKTKDAGVLTTIMAAAARRTDPS